MTASTVPFTEADLAYVITEYRTLEDLCLDRAEVVSDVRPLIEAGRLPGPADPRPGVDGWTSALRTTVDRLDEVERPFTEHDRLRWGPSTRDTRITEVRAVPRWGRALTFDA